ncbi:sigma-54 interaction domain-containing protein [Desulfoluna spongiiphila]|uniref:sigma-54 interaction domain-containing protein n=1 Tax=Desulfoluna spongiiphila TaxID=419481 RepID=UPI00125111E2|nr:sigma 54-interacting transcriptional regulator [Desulfoluna spongiiphila]VVS94326.1 consensus disorder prediction [Desulfoluna spongiiphila]
MDENAFFREATLRLCSSLAIEKGMSACLKHMRRYMPGHKLFLEYYESDLGALRTMAMATEDEGTPCDVLTPMEDLLLDGSIESPAPSDLDRVFCVNRAKGDPLSQVLLKRFQEPEESSILWIILAVETRVMGALTLIAKGVDRFTGEDARLFALLREPFTIAMSNTLEHRQVVRLKDLLADDNRYLQNEIGRLTGEEIIGADFGLKGVMEMVGQVAQLTSPVIITGETGAGKEVIARAIHNLSKRKQGPFIKVNCGAIPETLMDSELFGHEKGAFTGAVSQKRGRFERADGGTIFLDEIGELPPEAQVRLLRVLQEKEFDRVGGSRPVHVDIRVIAATHRDLGAMIREGRFREDLFYRLQVFPIPIPPLRQRLGDIPALIQHFITKKSREMGLGEMPPLAMGAMDRLKAYPWPGNVRELENTVERALILSKGKPLEFSELHSPPPGSAAQPPAVSGPESLELDSVVTAHIERVLKMTGGRVEGEGGAAELLGVNHSTLRHRMRRLNISFGRRSRTS